MLLILLAVMAAWLGFGLDGMNGPAAAQENPGGTVPLLPPRSPDAVAPSLPDSDPQTLGDSEVISINLGLSSHSISAHASIEVHQGEALLWDGPVEFFIEGSGQYVLFPIILTGNASLKSFDDRSMGSVLEYDTGLTTGQLTIDGSLGTLPVRRTIVTSATEQSITGIGVIAKVLSSALTLGPLPILSIEPSATLTIRVQSPKVHSELDLLIKEFPEHEVKIVRTAEGFSNISIGAPLLFHINKESNRDAIVSISLNVPAARNGLRPHGISIASEIAGPYNPIEGATKVDASGDAITLMAEIPNVETYIALYGVETVKSSPTIIDPEPEINGGVYPADVTDIQNGLSPGNNVLNITIALLSIVIMFVALFMFRLRR